MGVPLYVICHFSLAAFNNFSLSLIFASLITMCLGVFLLGFILYGTRCTSWTWVAISFPMLGKFSTKTSSNIFSDPFFFSSSSGTPKIWMLVCLMWSQMSLWLSSFFSFLFLYSALWQLFPLFYSPGRLSVLLSQLFCYLIPSRVFLILFIVLFIIVCLLFSSSRSLLNVSCIFSILFPRFWIIFTVILNSFSGRLPIYFICLFFIFNLYLFLSVALCVCFFILIWVSLTFNWLE